MSPNKNSGSMDGMRRPSGKVAVPAKIDKLPDPKLQDIENITNIDPSDEKELEQISAEETSKIKKSMFHQKHFWMKIIGAMLLLAVTMVSVVGYLWYAGQLSPVTDDTSKHVNLLIESGTSTNQIAEKLQSEHVIRSSIAFMIYVKLTGSEGKIKAGTYNLQPSLSTPAIVDHLVSGKQDTFRVTFLPGDTLANNRKVLQKLGLYSDAAIDAAITKTYDHPLFKSKPVGTDLEGYIFGETYEFDATSTPETILMRTFDQFWSYIEENNLISLYKKQGLNLYEGITLASIVQREVTNENDQKDVARVFLNRLNQGMVLGSDVTYQYAAKKLGVDPDPKLDSPYNTRINAGLPPGPIAAPGAGALYAVAHPSKHDYLFFLSGDDGKTYFANTLEQHEQNKALHCQKKCLIL